jgi:hypothetical protein
LHVVVDLYTMECGVKAMKNPFAAILLVSVLLSACGRKAAPPSAAPPAEDSTGSNPVVSMPEAAGPAGLPPCPGFVALESSKGDARAGSSVLLSGQPVASLLEFYATNLSADGWIMETTVRQGSEVHLQFRQGARFLRLQLGPFSHPGANSRLQLAWGPMAGTGAAHDAYEPEFEEDEPDVNKGSMEW